MAFNRYIDALLLPDSTQYKSRQSFHLPKLDLPKKFESSPKYEIPSKKKIKKQ